MTEQPELDPRLREEMGDWVMGYVARRRRIKRSLTLVGGSVVVGAAVLSTAAWIALAPKDVVDTHVSCFQASSTNARSVDNELVGARKIGDPAKNALELCAELWKAGVLSRTSSRPSDSHSGVNLPVPRLALCTRTDGTYTVFPFGPSASPKSSMSKAQSSSDLCQELGLLPVPGH